MNQDVGIYQILLLTMRQYRSILFFSFLLALFLVVGNEKVFPERFEAVSIIKTNFDEWQNTLFGKINPHTEQRDRELTMARQEILSRSNIEYSMKRLMEDADAGVEPKPSFLQKIMTRIYDTLSIAPKPFTLDDEISALQTAVLLQSDQFNPGFFEVKMRSSSPYYAETVVNGIVDGYIAQQIDVLKAAFVAKIDSFVDQLEIINRDIENAETDIADYVQNNPNAIETRDSLSRARESLRDTEFLIKDLQVREAQLLALLRKTPETLRTPLTTSVATSDDLIRQKESQLAEYRTRMSERHPQVVQLVNEIRALKRTASANTAPFHVSPNPEYARIRYDLVNVQSSLEKARFQITELNKLVHSGKPLTDNTKVKGQSALIENLVLNRVNIETQLANERARLMLIENLQVPFIEVIDRAHVDSRLFRPRHLLMSMGLLFAILAVFGIYSVKSYFFLRRVQTLYGIVIDMPKDLNIRMIENRMDEDTRTVEQHYRISYHKEPNANLIACQNESSSSNELVLIKPAQQDLQTFTEPSRISQIAPYVLVDIAEEINSRFDRPYYFALTCAGFVFLVAYIFLQYFHDHFIIL